MRKTYLGDTLNYQIPISELIPEMMKIFVIVTNCILSKKTLGELRSLHEVYVKNYLVGHVRYSISFNVIVNGTKYFLSRNLSNVDLDGEGICNNIPFEGEIFYDSLVNSYKILPGNSKNGIFANIPSLRDENWYNDLSFTIAPKDDYAALEFYEPSLELHYFFRYDLFIESDRLEEVLKNTKYVVTNLHPLGVILPRI